MGRPLDDCHGKPAQSCRGDERLKTKAEESTRLAYTLLSYVSVMPFPLKKSLLRTAPSVRESSQRVCEATRNQTATVVVKYLFRSSIRRKL
jgi:hypothetical protein